MEGQRRTRPFTLQPTSLMDGEMYRDLLQRIALARSVADLDALTERVLERGGASPRRRALLHAIEERRQQLEHG